MHTQKTIAQPPGGAVENRRPAGNRLGRATVERDSMMTRAANRFQTLGRAYRSLISRVVRAGVLLGLVAVWACAPEAHARDATWLLNPGSGDFDTGSNWSGEVVPTGTAFFDHSSITTITFSASTAIGGLTFNAGAPAYSFGISSSFLEFVGAGIVNNSSNAPTLTDSGPQGIFFVGSSTAGNAVINNITSGFTEFANSSTGGTAIITNTGGNTFFIDTSTSGNAIITNNSNGATEFANSSTAGTAAITNSSGGNTFFVDTSTAGNATVTTNAGSFTEFDASSTAGSATVITNSGGFTIFQSAATGGTARFITNAGGTFDISNISSSGITVGSIEGAGAYRLGSKVLTVGLNNLSTTVSGTITDGGFSNLPGGSLIKVGTGTLTLTGSNTYTGGTTISGGTLQIGSGGTTGSIVGNVVDNAALVFDRSDAFTFSGLISRTGTVTQGGTGTLILTGANTYTGQTTVNNGSLIVNGSIASTQTLVNPGGLLGGTGLIGGNLVNSGIVSPGNPVGTLTVSGNYTQNANGTLRIDIGGTAPGQFGLLAVNGHASLAGTLQLIPLGSFQFHLGDRITFLTANGGVRGSFSTIQNPFIAGTIVKAEVNVLPDAVQILATQGDFVTAACNPNSAAVARNLNAAASDPRAVALISFLDSQPIGSLCADFSLISPEEIAAIFNIGVSTAGIQAINLIRRMDDIHAGSSGFSAAGFSMKGSPASFTNGFSGPAGAEGKAGPPVLAPGPENRWGIFVTGVGEFTHVDGTDGAAGFDLQTGGVTLGADYRFTSNFAVGLTAGYAHVHADLVNNGSVDVNSGKFGAYATVFGNGLYLDTAVTGSVDGYDTHRTALLGTANGSTNGSEVSFLVAGGYDWKKGGLTISPTANFQYTYVNLDGFTESGSLAPLKYPYQHVDSETTAFGVKSIYDWHVGHVLLRPEISLAWQHEYGDQAYSVLSSLANGAGGIFSVTGPTIGRDSLLVGAGLAVLWNDRISTYIYYDGDLARTNYQSNNITAGVRMTF
ncbi:MAG: autotransporter domain-containing protein [Verrucomicrobia bacterium]|nr:autotransporter domain-containing protein [Verrucomicrobiota bacterium]